MSIREQCSSSIAKIGQWITASESLESFRGSIQPHFGGNENLSDLAGYGTQRRFTLYASWDGVSALLKQGDMIATEKEQYQVMRIETITVQGTPAYRKGTLHLIREDS